MNRSRLSKIAAPLTLALLVVFATACAPVHIDASPTQTLSEITMCHANHDGEEAYTPLILGPHDVILHILHDQDDIIPAPATGCPDKIVKNSSREGVTICHLMNKNTKSYRKIALPSDNLALHIPHTGDFLLAAQDKTCPNQISTATPTPTKTPRPTSTPKAATHTQTPTQSPTITVTASLTPTPESTATASPK